jgi:hypothetical protein
MSSKGDLLHLEETEKGKLLGFPKLTRLTNTKTLNWIKHWKLLRSDDLVEYIAGGVAKSLVPHHIKCLDSNEGSKALQLIGLKVMERNRIQTILTEPLEQHSSCQVVIHSVMG